MGVCCFFVLWELFIESTANCLTRLQDVCTYTLPLDDLQTAPVLSTTSGSSPDFPFFTVSSSERDGAEQEKRESRDYEALVVLGGFKIV